MSRLGKTPVLIPAGVTVTVDGQRVSVVGPKGTLQMVIRPEIAIEVAEGKILTSIRRNTKGAQAYWGMSRALLANLVKGVTEGFEKKLELVGVGYRAKQEGSKKLILAVGYSHPVEFDMPEGIELLVEENKNITLKGIDKQLVGLTAANIKKVRKPEPYKGKGIRYMGEVVRRKAGKSGKA